MIPEIRNALNDSSGLVHLLRQRGFIDLVSATVGGEKYNMANYGPLGTLLRRNILKQWWDLMVATQTNVFPIESPFLNSIEFEDMIKPTKSFNHFRSSLQKDCTAKYSQVLKLTNGKLPISIASVGTCLLTNGKWNPTEQVIEKALLLGTSVRTKLTLQNYVSPSSASAIHDFWLQTRLSWWKKFSRSPEHFSVTSVATNGNGDSGGKNTDEDLQLSTNSSTVQTLSIVYEFPWGQEVVESVTNLSDSLFKQLPQPEREAYMVKLTGKKAFLPACIECDTSMESVMAAWLVDAYHERYPSASGQKHKRSKVQQVLQLHHQVAPYQVAIAVCSSSSPSSSSPSSSIELRYVSENMEKSLKKAGISVFNASHHGGSLDAHFKRNDQLGIVYTIIIDHNTVTDGLVKTRSRDTQVKVSSHISGLVKELQRNLNAQLE
ncbi:hypothetical protein RRG08_054859 [Elysia crispata]|uniref:Anticodon-binding domain-containing protein n=1 Tax=Elysia crispata TaxID=231223 RepID=A0AAE1A5E9_9GAST|nr:hypothetical protein RRG08_054859 [Elysia crispata]